MWLRCHETPFVWRTQTVIDCERHPVSWRRFLDQSSRLPYTLSIADLTWVNNISYWPPKNTSHVRTRPIPCLQWGNAKTFSENCRLQLSIDVWLVVKMIEFLRVKPHNTSHKSTDAVSINRMRQRKPRNELFNTMHMEDSSVKAVTAEPCRAVPDRILLERTFTHIAYVVNRYVR